MNVNITKAFASNLTDTLVDVVPAWGRAWIICTDKVYLFKYDARGNTKYLAYTFAPASTGELIQCAIGFNGYLYLGTTCPDHASNARVLRLEMAGDDSPDDLITDDGTFLTATAELAASSATALEHTFLGFAIADNVLYASYQYTTGMALTCETTIYRQTDHATWGAVGFAVVLEMLNAATARGSRWRTFAGINNILVRGERDWATSNARYIMHDLRGVALGTAAYDPTAAAPHVNIGTYGSDFFCVFNSTLVSVPDWNPDYNLTRRPLDAVDLWFENYGSSATLNPAFISDADWYGGITWFDNYFTGLKLVEDDGAGSLTTYYCLAHREADGNWCIDERTLNTATGAVQLAPKYTIWLDGELRILAPHANVNNFSIITPDYGGTVWSKRSGI